MCAHFRWSSHQLSNPVNSPANHRLCGNAWGVTAVWFQVRAAAHPAQHADTQGRVLTKSSLGTFIQELLFRSADAAQECDDVGVSVLNCKLESGPVFTAGGRIIGICVLAAHSKRCCIAPVSRGHVGFGCKQHFTHFDASVKFFAVNMF